MTEPTWRTDAPPLDEIILAEFVGYPFVAVTLWNDHEQQWVYPMLQVNLINGEWCDPYFQNELAHPAELIHWLPLPNLPPHTKAAGRPTPPDIFAAGDHLCA